ncbi:hypothetical protein JI664_03545 [Rhodobacter sp. NTK016B]|uniref:hypothetical protein n=1 Tax=Rhodobacter sp. NTK016B TaxID=2759676 RepID=UPI001A8FF3A4|nr:hypothetical protein [Rhodobacter sp. NTK016B]MBN8291031.1 hypothetical protein [Rhodobacter sp. NTK016B]
MSAERKALRADLRAAVASAIAEHAPLAGARIVSAWAQDISPDALPIVGIAVPTEGREPATMDTMAQDFRAVVVVKMKAKGLNGTDGPEAENALDDAAIALIDPIEAALMRGTGPARDVALQSSAIDISGTGSPRIGTLTLTFGVQSWCARMQP